MKRTKKQVLSLITVGYLLLNTIVMSGAVFAETVPSEKIKTTTSSSTAPKESLSSTMPTIPTPSTSYSEPIVSSEPKEEKRVLTYEDNHLLEAVKADSAIPAVVFQTKGLENGLLTIQGTASAGREENQSETILSALILQRQAESGEWEDAHHFSVGKNGVNLAETEFPFEYSEEVEKTGEASYRLAADYTIKYSNEDEQPQKGSVEIGKVIKVETKDSEKQTEETTSENQESTESIQESTTEATQNSTEKSTEQGIVESSGPKVESKQEETIVIDPSAGVGTTSPNTLGENSQIPKMADTYRDAFQRGLGITPLKVFVNSGITPTTTPGQLSYNADYSYIEKPTITARYTSKTRLSMRVRFVWNYLGFSSGMSIDEATATDRIDKEPYSFNVKIRYNRWGAKTETIKGNLTRDHLVQYEGDGTEAQLGKGLDDFKTTRNISITHPDMWTWKAWSNNVTEIEFTNILVHDTIWLDFSFSKGHNANANFNFQFVDPQVEDLTNISKPVFKATDGVTDKVKIQDGTYSGDTNDKKGMIDLALPGWGNYTVLDHKDGKYNGKDVTSLEPGTDYLGRVTLYDWLGKACSTDGVHFQTPNAVKKPVPKSYNIPTNWDNAEVTFTGDYVVGGSQSGTSAAHPKPPNPNDPNNNGLEIALSLDNNKWFNRPLENASLSTGNKQMTYTLKGLEAGKQYYTRYRVKNASGAWSPWAYSDPFMTKNVGVVVNPPTFDPAFTTATQVKMNKGSYKGTTSLSYLNTGNVQYTSDLTTPYPSVPPSLWKEVETKLPHDNGIYGEKLITGLTPGTTYRVQVGLRDEWDSSKYKFSDTNNGNGWCYTLNTVAQPTTTLHPSTGKNNASATFSGIYGVGNAPAHPDQVKVQIRLDSSPTWQDIDGSSTPKLDSQSIDTSTTTGNFTINKMKANTQYHVRYKVQNKGGWSEWSASEGFTTPVAPANMEIIDAPKLDFGMLKNENFSQKATLDAASQKNHVEVENTIITKGWKLTAKLDQLKRTDNPSILMPWATLKMDINLQNSTDDGTTWTDYVTGVSGSPGIVTIDSGAAAKTLWSISNPNHAQGYFRTKIDWTKVTLDVPANQTGMYAGNLVWSLDDTP